ncbi:efflux RND transporter periplasmic adaptor subunit [Polymorphobacter fuscus]|uniref:Efflux RND transporter periplasmic adaptor subunit n=1 Tax=Sandarakinorhabdus fusca TaxID=1439888 RepID=A0A7C9GW36_9SPHN|nr:efflux RND transporter periplasmic adaptor subunit [Polymorphobacter fuscus]KAB7648833.1 efflux RND transporter periplasmic adaptor subunit [Polymorphobacter fuscus]MQT16414.1 efflux RND transporter periplasmic adaptor subunit [Polymorphobacter fuscus]NJC07296.1 membrane fusion protein (multidrug efflux system) [Polymorphobacter fuscus]
MSPRRPAIALLSFAAALAVSGCGADTSSKQRGPKGPPQVGYVTVARSSVPLVTELAGRVTAFEMSEVRPQVAGIVRERLFTEGAVVRKGQTLYRIDPRLYAATVDQARANLASAQATAEAARISAGRLRPLAKIEAVSAQDLTNAEATSRQADAAVAQNRAALETARINLEFTTVPAPITGRIGRSLFTVGALVTTSQADPLAVIQRLDPIFVDMQQSSADLLALRRSLASGGIAPTVAKVRLILEDGSDYGMTGTVQFAEVMVNASTGTVTLRAKFPNPRGVLLPGMFVRARFAQGVDRGAILVPQAAVSRDPKGQASVFIVGPDNKAIDRTVTAARAQGPDWVVTAGLQPGDRVIVQGTANVKPGAVVRPVAADTPQKIVVPAKKPS